MQIPTQLRYTKEHEWVDLVSEKTIRVGITDYAQDALGDVVFVQIPTVGKTMEQHALLAEVESTKSVAEVYAPIAGKVVAVNERLSTQPELLNQDPYGEGWFCELEIEDAAAVENLLDADAYKQLTE
ncbi:MAG: glycine cleavage system protein GcvH [Acidimicrobiia bacterium]|nr:glycine cleavage system protein GcvH [Acidimicrobiia bacterium]MDQ3500035.1 glycine cleavage system protein GcvH [Actinomycetota bacterium]